MFKFRLQTVLDYRTFLEDRKKMELAEKQRAYQAEKQKGDLLRERRIQYHEAMRREAAKDEIYITLLSTYQNYIVVIENQTLVQDQKTGEAREEMAVIQNELIEAKKQKEVMVRVKENSHKKYKYAEDLKNQKTLDEISSIKYIRTNRGMDNTAQAVRI